MAASLALGFSAVAEAAGWPPGPRLAYIRSGEPTRGEQIISADASNEIWFKLSTAWPLFAVDRLAWSPDGSKLAFGGLFMPAVMVTSPEHVMPRPVRGSEGGLMPVYSPDGESIVFSQMRLELPTKKRSAFVGLSIWLVPARGGKARQLTPWRNGHIVMAASFSPDGRMLAAERTVRFGSPEVVLQPLRGGPARLLAKGAGEPAFSPDGSKIALVRNVRRSRSQRGRGLGPGTDLFLVDPDGRVLRRLTRTPGRPESSPSWDPSGERLVFVRGPAKRTLPARAGVGGSIFEINADGSCRRKLAFTLGLVYRSPVWQPGSGREAGRIEC